MPTRTLCPFTLKLASRNQAALLDNRDLCPGHRPSGSSGSRSSSPQVGSKVSPGVDLLCTQFTSLHFLVAGSCKTSSLSLRTVLGTAFPMRAFLQHQQTRRLCCCFRLCRTLTSAEGTMGFPAKTTRPSENAPDSKRMKTLVSQRERKSGYLFTKEIRLVSDFSTVTLHTRMMRFSRKEC